MNLLILSCSQTKRSTDKPLPALERYDGPAFRVLRRFLGSQPNHPLDIYILSAQFGLINGRDKISNYDQKMTKERSIALNSEILASLTLVMNKQNYDKVLICVTQAYLSSIDGYSEVIPKTAQLILATGTIGRKLSILHQWLYGKNRDQVIARANHKTSSRITLNGMNFDLKNVNILDVIRQALANGKGKPYNYQTWYVVIDNKKISPKWLVSQLTGLSVSSFHSHSARRFLRQIGIVVQAKGL